MGNTVSSNKIVSYGIFVVFVVFVVLKASKKTLGSLKKTL